MESWKPENDWEEEVQSKYSPSWYRMVKFESGAERLMQGHEIVRLRFQYY